MNLNIIFKFATIILVAGSICSSSMAGVCDAGGIGKLTIRSFSGQLCKNELIAAWAEKIVRMLQITRNRIVT
jgi:hypothetical protein